GPGVMGMVFCYGALGGVFRRILASGGGI
ncbi:MAG: hypothetical protein ACI92Z_002055, partial [Paracoccaceae bacterium]